MTPTGLNLSFATHATPNFLAAANPLDHVVDKTWLYLPAFGGFSDVAILTNAVIMTIVAGVLVLMTMNYAAHRAVALRGRAPTGFYNFVEMVLQFVRKDMAEPILGKNTDRYIPYLWTAFFFVLYANLLGMLPIKDLSALIFYMWSALLFQPNPDLLHKGLGGTATGSIWVTLALAMCTFFMFIGAGIREHGLKGFALHLTAGVPVKWAFAPILAIIVVVEIMGLFVKPFALAVRLFANMTAGHTLLAVLYGFGVALVAQPLYIGLPVTIIAIIGGIAISVLEVFVALLQAYIFTFLSCLFIGQMLEHGDSEHAEHGEHEHHGHDAHVEDGHGAHAIGEDAANLSNGPDVPKVYPGESKSQRELEPAAH